MKAVRRKFDFCSIFAKNIDVGYTLELILRVHRLYVSSNNKKNKSTHVPPVLLYNVRSKVHEHNAMRHFLHYFSCCQTQIPLTISSTRAFDQPEKKGTCTYKCIYVLFLKMGPSKF